MITQPGIFLLDEPFSNLDAAFRAYMRGELKRLQRSLGQTMIYVTHDQVEAMSMADKIAVMYCGELYQYGSPDDVYNWPVNTFVARFIGSPNMNFVKCAYRGENGQGVLVQKAGGMRTPVDDRRRGLLEGSPHADDLIFGIRPEHIKLTPQPTADSVWQGVVYATEPLGPKTVVHLKVGDDMVEAITPAAYRPHVGETQYIGLNLPSTHVFDAQTKNVIR
jgi:ABC-type sugar transport system ATPase subunit